MNGKAVQRSGTALLVLLACAGLTGCNYSSTSTMESVPQTGIALLRFTSAGAPDTSFGGGDGIAVTDIDPSQFDFAIAAALQPADGKIIVAGRSVLGSQGVIALLRYNADGTLDTNFGNGGIVRTAVGSVDASATAVALQADGKILAAGITFTASTGATGIALVRYGNTNGALDATFGTQGIVTAAIGSGSDADTASLAVQADGKIVVAGASSTGNIVLVRYVANGGLDPNFGTNGTGGITITSVGTASMSPAIALQSTGKIVVAGATGSFAAPPVDAILLRYNADGTLDTSFGTSGKVITDIGLSTNFANAVVVQPDDKIVVAGHAFVDFAADRSDIALLRYDANGALDSTFGTGGIVVTDLGAFDNALGLALQTIAADLKIVVSGNTGSGGMPRVAVLRYNSNGTLDSTFGSNGVVTTSAVGPSNISSGNAVAVQSSDGSIVVAGYD